MKDFTPQIEENLRRKFFDQHPTAPSIPTQSYPIKFVLTEPGTSKLQLVKTIKDLTGLGLKDSKDIVDASVSTPIMFRMNLNLSQIDKFKEGLGKCTGVKFELDDRNKIRNKKLIDLGICDVDDIIEEIVDTDMNNLFNEGFDSSKLRDLLHNIYSKMQEKQLKEIYEGTL